MRRFIGGPAGDEIMLVSDEEDPHLRWRFTDIGPASFRWRGEVSRDGGATWELEEEMHAARRAPVNGAYSASTAPSGWTITGPESAVGGRRASRAQSVPAVASLRRLG